MNDLISEYQQYQDATTEEDNAAPAEEEAAWWILVWIKKFWFIVKFRNKIFFTYMRLVRFLLEEKLSIT
jgi:hypothetical protein